MEKELLEMSRLWKKTALEMLEKSEPASRSEFANQMLLACAEMLESKLITSLEPTAPHTPT
jgi:hypothetical protein